MNLRSFIHDRTIRHSTAAVIRDFFDTLQTALGNIKTLRLSIAVLELGSFEMVCSLA